MYELLKEASDLLAAATAAAGVEDVAAEVVQDPHKLMLIDDLFAEVNAERSLVALPPPPRHAHLLDGAVLSSPRHSLGCWAEMLGCAQ